MGGRWGWVKESSDLPRSLDELGLLEQHLWVLFIWVNVFVMYMITFHNKEPRNLDILSTYSVQSSSCFVLLQQNNIRKLYPPQKGDQQIQCGSFLRRGPNYSSRWIAQSCAGKLLIHNQMPFTGGSDGAERIFSLYTLKWINTIVFWLVEDHLHRIASWKEFGY